jgi:drug/metabolite transporter (DMT)-like permease
MATKNKSQGGYFYYLVLFILWYSFNAGYNVYNAHLKVFPFPISVAFGQVFVGLLYVIPLWILGFRSAPKLSFSDFLQYFPIVIMNAVGHVCTVIAMFQKGGGSFTHVVKASEPVMLVLLGLVINGTVPKPLTALSLFPISYGVAYASTLGNLEMATLAKELTTVTAMMAMTGNCCFAMRSLLRKNLTAEYKVNFLNYFWILFIFYG